MADTTVKKVSSASSPTGDEGQVYLASGKRVSMRLWRDEEPTQDKPPRKHDEIDQACRVSIRNVGHRLMFKPVRRQMI